MTNNCLRAKNFIFYVLITNNRQKQWFCYPKMADFKAWSHCVRKANCLFNFRHYVFYDLLFNCPHLVQFVLEMSFDMISYYMVFQNPLFWLVVKRYFWYFTVQSSRSINNPLLSRHSTFQFFNWDLKWLESNIGCPL